MLSNLQNVILIEIIIKQTQIKWYQISFCSHHCAYWWPSTTIRRAICRHCDDQVVLPHIYGTGSWGSVMIWITVIKLNPLFREGGHWLCIIRHNHQALLHSNDDEINICLTYSAAISFYLIQQCVGYWIYVGIWKFLPEASFGLWVLSLHASVPQSVRPSVTKFVSAITHHPFQLGSPNLDQICKRPWLRSL